MSIVIHTCATAIEGVKRNTRCLKEGVRVVGKRGRGGTPGDERWHVVGRVPVFGSLGRKGEPGKEDDDDDDDHRTVAMASCTVCAEEKEEEWGRQGEAREKGVVLHRGDVGIVVPSRVLLERVLPSMGEDMDGGMSSSFLFTMVVCPSLSAAAVWPVSHLLS